MSVTNKMLFKKDFFVSKISCTFASSLRRICHYKKFKFLNFIIMAETIKTGVKILLIVGPVVIEIIDILGKSKK